MTRQKVEIEVDIPDNVEVVACWLPKKGDKFLYSNIVDETIPVTRSHRYKRDATRDAKRFKQLGGEQVVVTGKRGAWVASARITVWALAKFCAEEARRESRKDAV